MNKSGFAAMYMVYSLFLIFILMMLTVLLVNNYKSNFLNILKNDIKEELKDENIPIKTEQIEENTQNNPI